MLYRIYLEIVGTIL